MTSVYLPMYLYEGNYSCSVGYQESWMKVGTNMSGNKTIKEKSVTKWRPMTATAKNNFAFLSLAFEGSEIIPELAEWTRTFPYDPVSSKAFDMNFLMGKDVQILPHNLDKESTWHRWGSNTIEYRAEQRAIEQLPTGERTKDFKSNFSYTPKHDGHLFLVPFWFVYYHYNGEKHFVLSDGLGKNRHGNTPIDNALVKSVKNFGQLGKARLWIGILLGILTLLTGAGFVWGATAFVVSWLTIKLFSKFKV